MDIFIIKKQCKIRQCRINLSLSALSIINQYYNYIIRKSRITDIVNTYMFTNDNNNNHISRSLEIIVIIMQEGVLKK